MLDLARLERIRLTRRPGGQVFVGQLLRANYAVPPGVEIVLEGEDRVPEESVIYAMNHTDRYNYFPFQLRLLRQLDRFTATWVKGKYYESALLGKFMEWTNNLPTVSRGYLITRDFKSVTQRTPKSDEYAVLRKWVDASAAGESPGVPKEVQSIPSALFDEPRNVLGRAFDPSKEDYAAYINAMFITMMSRFLELNRKTFECGLDLLIFPQGTRSLRLSRGHIGLAEIALHFRKSIVPVGCSGSDRLYPGASPFAKPGRVVYRFGEPISYEEMSPFHIEDDFEPFRLADEDRHRARFQGLVDLVMDRINELVDPPYRYSDEFDSASEKAGDRFI